MNLMNGLQGMLILGLVDIKSQQKLLLFGGYDYGTHQALDEIWMFDYKSVDTMLNGWTKIENIKLPKGTLNSGYTLSNDEKYVFIFGGSDPSQSGGDGDAYLDDIYILNVGDLENMELEIRKSVIKCPVNDLFHAMVMPKNPVDEIVVFGWLRECLRNIEMEMCMDLWIMMLGWYSCDFVHLLKDDGHWKIPVNDLLCD